MRRRPPTKAGSKAPRRECRSTDAGVKLSNFAVMGIVSARQLSSSSSALVGGAPVSLVVPAVFTLSIVNSLASCVNLWRRCVSNVTSSRP